ncbi:FG-GAP-like repeat-containing protein [Streptomyces xanthochromogenes]|uniref:trypsin-like serine protease n=1 Tax=Streptomyces xanthochromogenes TaxID=67384 RepID=UPI00342879AD
MLGKSSRTAWTPTLLATAVGAGLLTAAPASALTGSDAGYAFTAKLNIGDAAACTGTLVDPQWVLTAASCFAVDGKAATAGKPAVKTTITVGRTDLSQTGGSVREGVELVPRTDRDVVMVKLAQPVVGVKTARIASSAPASGEELVAAGFGRTKTEWVPDKLHSGVFPVASVDTRTVGLNGSDKAAICQGDAGGPALRGSGDRAELVGVVSRSWQGGCLGTDASETRTGAVAARTDDLNPWIQQVRALPKTAKFTSGDYNGDGKDDVAALYNYGEVEGRGRVALWVFTSDGKTLTAPRTWWDSQDGAWNWNAVQLTSGDYNGDGKDDVGILYNYGQTGDGRNQTGLWTFTSTGSGFKEPAKVWDSGSGSWNWDRSKLTSGDYNGDGKADIGVLYNYGQTGDGRNQTGLFSFAGTGSGFKEPAKVWDSGSGSWNWDRSKVTSADFNGDGKLDVAVLYNDGQDSNGRNHTGLWFAGGATGLGTPKKVWDSGNDSWNWNASKLTAGDYNGDGKADIGILYNYGQTGDGRNQTGLWTMNGTTDGVSAPQKVWDSGSGSWNWDWSDVVSGDFDGDGKKDLAAWYTYGPGPDGRDRSRLFTFTSTGTGMAAPVVQWDSSLG